MSISTNIKNARIAAGLTQSELANRIGMKQQTIQKYENGIIANIPSDKIEKIAKVLDCSPAYLMGWEENKVIEKIGGVPYNPTKKIPILGTISAGLPLYAEEHIEGYTYTDLNGRNEYFALIVHGDSMNAVKIDDGDVLIVRRQNAIENGEIAVVLVGDENATVKRFYQDGSIVTLMPQSTNPKHKPQIYQTNKVKIQILGKVVRNQITFE